MPNPTFQGSHKWGGLKREFQPQENHRRSLQGVIYIINAHNNKEKTVFNLKYRFSFFLYISIMCGSII